MCDKRTIKIHNTERHKSLSIIKSVSREALHFFCTSVSIFPTKKSKIGNNLSSDGGLHCCDSMWPDVSCSWVPSSLHGAIAQGSHYKYPLPIKLHKPIYK